MGRHPYTDRSIDSPIVSKRGVKIISVFTFTFCSLRHLNTHTYTYYGSPGCVDTWTPKVSRHLNTHTYTYYGSQ